MVLVDTSIIIDFINNNIYKEEIITLLENKKFTTTEIIIMEVLQGIKDDKTYDKIKSFLESLPLVEVRYDDFLEAANIYRICRKRGITIRKSIDCIIAAIAINNNLELFSNDMDFDNIRKHFELIRYEESRLINLL
ncbi:MAG TPA: PIN domain-containing protein [Candidatus Kapabacteria bacterium]|nr:PIN domain-containing protein [Candidatus Kapabacteria bacterium]